VYVQRFLFRDPERIDRMVRGATDYPSIAEGLIDYATGRLTYRAAKRRLMVNHPTVAGRLALEAWLFPTPAVPDVAQ
jgi:hypothetical protein